MNAASGRLYHFGVAATLRLIPPKDLKNLKRHHRIGPTRLRPVLALQPFSRTVWHPASDPETYGLRTQVGAPTSRGQEPHCPIFYRVCRSSKNPMPDG